MAPDETPGEDRFRELVFTLAELQVTVGLIGSVMPRFPETVQENWDEKVGLMISWASQQIEEVQSFGQAFDES